MSEKKQKYDMNSPEAKALIDEIVHGTFLKEGTMAAFPTCFPGASIPIPADESHITALAVAEDGMVYGGTSGRATHLFVGIFHGVTGIIFDRGTVADADHCAAMVCGKGKFVAAVNGKTGGRLVSGGFEPLPFDLIQEWGFGRSPLQEMGKVSSDPIVHAVADASRSRMIGITTRQLFTADLEAGKIELRADVPGRGRIAFGSKGGLFGQDGESHLWRYDLSTQQLQRKAVALPTGEWSGTPLTWATDRHSGTLYTADNVGNLFAFDEDRGFGSSLGRTLLAPVGPMAVTNDGRVFGACGPEMAKLFCFNPATREITNLGVAVSLLERRRYGYVFGDAVVGRDGQVYFGEDDDLGHLWIYFPRIQGVRP